MPNVLIYGGAFDPIHWGHLAAATTAKNFLAHTQGVDYELWFTPSYCDTFSKKQGLGDNIGHRLEMLKLALKNELTSFPNSLICTLELESKNKMGTYELMKELSRRYPKYNFKFLMGADAAVNIGQWRNSRKLRREFELVIVARNVEHKVTWAKTSTITRTIRPGFEWASMKGSKHTTIFRPPTELGVSSTRIKELIKEGKWGVLRSYLPNSVQKYIREAGLYQGEYDE